MEAVLVKKSSKPIEVLSRAAMTVEQDSIIGVKARELVKTGPRDFQGVCRIHLFGKKGNTIEKLLFVMNSKAAKVLSWPGVMEIGISA